jgi:hypothetical protein
MPGLELSLLPGHLIVLTNLTLRLYYLFATLEIDCEKLKHSTLLMNHRWAASGQKRRVLVNNGN